MHQLNTANNQTEEHVLIALVIESMIKIMENYR